MGGRPYVEDSDFEAIARIWREVGWIGSDVGEVDALRTFLRSGPVRVADVAGSAECSVQRVTGSMRIGTGRRATDLPLAVISSVTTSHIGKRQGLAPMLLGETLAEAVAGGAAVSSLGIFDQGYYERYGYGTGAYDHTVGFDPANLTVPVPHRPPVRLTVDDAEEIHELRRRRHRGHGSVVIDPSAMFVAEFGWLTKPFGLGFRDEDGRLTHCLVASLADGHGPATIEVLVYERPAQLLELLGLTKLLGDQIRLVYVKDEPADIQLQDVIAEPQRHQWHATESGNGRALHRAQAGVQHRIMDLDACIGAWRTTAPPVYFSLRLHDPIADLDLAWSGVGGNYTVHLGEESSISQGLDPSLPTLDCSVNALSRLWLGVRPASALALTEHLAGPDFLIDALDDAGRAPTPLPGWAF